MTDIPKLIDEIADTQARLYNTQFLAPCFRGGRICARVAGIVYNFTPQPSEFEGWGIFQPVGEKQQRLSKRQTYPKLTNTCNNFPKYGCAWHANCASKVG